ncbi:DUF4651 domain-containing protein, partial [Streptococcus equi]|nr:DUF4651 domain-containing protein [Streptococcus equi]
MVSQTVLASAKNLLVSLGLRLKEVYQERERQRVLVELRAFFSALGEIEVLYINSFSS